jgi:hypothetical protein
MFPALHSLVLSRIQQTIDVTINDIVTLNRMVVLSSLIERTLYAIEGCHQLSICEILDISKAKRDL